MLFENDTAGKNLIRPGRNQAKFVHFIIVEQILGAAVWANNRLRAISTGFAPLYDRSITRVIAFAEVQEDFPNNWADGRVDKLVDARRAGGLHSVFSDALDGRRVCLKFRS